jgi:hypothetical protein
MMTEGIEPMTAAEYRSEVGVPRTILGERLLAALEERDANLAHARIGSLVAAIREKRLALRDVSGKGGNFVIGVGEPRIYFLVHDDDGFEEALSHLDSLLPKEPEVVVGPSGDKFRVRDGKVEVLPLVGSGNWMESRTLLLADAPVVAALLARQEGKGNG